MAPSISDVERILADAVEIRSPTERHRFVQEACGGDIELKRQVEELIANHFNAGEFLERPPHYELLAAGDSHDLGDDTAFIEMPGTMIGPYKLREVLGEGGMGIVYVAEQERPVRRKVALKVIKPGMDTREVIARFETERQALALMDHPHIAKVLDAGTTGDGKDEGRRRKNEATAGATPSFSPHPSPLSSARPYFVMELVRGVPITDHCDQAKLTHRERLELFVKVCQAIQHAHHKGIIHRDLKPSNVLVALHDGTPVPKVIDFGVAKAINQRLTEHTVYTRMSQILGTPMYMSPEQAELSALDVDTRSDVYALGVLLYELLTGTTPFAKETLNRAPFDEMRRIIREVEPPRPSQRVSTLTAQVRSTVSGKCSVDERQFVKLLSGELDWIVMKALEKDRQRRYESASALVADIQRYLADEPVEACPPSTMYRLKKFVRRNQASLVATTFVATVLLGGGALTVGLHQLNLSRYNRDLKRVNDDLEQAREQAVELQHSAEANERQTRDALYAADVNRAAVSLAGGDTRAALVLLQRHLPKGGAPAATASDRRGFEWWHLRRRMDRAHQIWLDAGSPQYVLSHSGDGRLVAAAGKDAVVRLFDAPSGAMVRIIATGQIEVNGVAFSPDGKELATAGDDGTVRVWDLSSGAQRWQAAAHPEKAFQLRYTRDGKKIISCGDNPEIRIFGADSGRMLETLRGHKRVVQCLLVADTTLISGSDDDTARLWRLDSGDQAGQITSAGRIWTMDYVPTRDLLITGNDDNEVETWSLRERRRISQVSHLDSIHSVALHPAGRLLAAGDAGGSLRIWNIDAEGRIAPDAVCIWQAHTGSAYSLLWSPDGSRLISAGKDGRVMSWNMEAEDSSRGPRRLAIDPSNSFSLIPGTTSLVTAGGENRALVRWNWSTGTEEGRFSDQVHYQQALASPNGKLLAAVRGDRILDVLPVDESFEPPPHVRQLLLEWNPGGTLGRMQFAPDSESFAVSFQPDGTEGQPEAKRLWLVGPPHFGRSEPLPVPEVARAAFSPDGRRLALAAGTKLVLWDIAARQAVWERPQSDTTMVAFSDDGKLLITGGHNRLAIVWDAQEGDLRFRLAGHLSPIRSFAISPDSATLATASRDGVIKLWHLPTGQELFELRKVGSGCRFVQFSEDGSRLFAQVDGGDGLHDEILIFDATRD